MPTTTPEIVERLRDSHALKLTGKAELPERIPIGHNYEVTLSGSVVSELKHDNDDGSFTFYYTFRPVKIELLTPKGESLKLKDTRSASQLLRARLWKQWQNAKSELPFDDWYFRLMTQLIQNVEELVEMYGK